MELRMPSVAELFESVGKQIGGQVGSLLEQTALEMTAVTGRPPKTAMQMILERQEYCFCREDAAMLLELSSGLGRYDLTGQARLLGLYKNRLDEMIQKEEEQLQRRAKASMTASVCAGLALILVLL